MLRGFFSESFRHKIQVGIASMLLVLMAFSVVGTFAVPAAKAGSPPKAAGGSLGSGSVAGGTPVDLTMFDFDMGAKVFFGGVQATTTFSNPPTDLHVLTPPHAAGMVQVVVQNPDMSQSDPMDFTYVVPPPPLPSCQDIKGKGRAILVGGVANSGIVNFDPIGGKPQKKYEACVIDPDGKPADGNFKVEGWAWDDNLGWISFYCPAGGGAQNLGVDCAGGYIGGYGVEINQSGSFSGYAWSDNAGWISFNTGVSQLKVDTTKDNCMGYAYSDDPPLPNVACPNNHVKGDAFVWSDSVGWLDFSTVLFPWKALITGVDEDADKEAKDKEGKKIDPFTGVQLSINPDPTLLDLNTAPLANGVDKYTVKLSIHTKNGDLLGPGYAVTAVPTWDFDTVAKDQIAPMSVNNKTCTDVNGAVTKACDTMNGGSAEYESYVTSLAPTSNMNFWDKDGDGSQDLDEPSFESFVLPTSKAAAANKANKVALKYYLVKVIDMATGKCAYPNPGSDICTAKNVYPTYADGSMSAALKFRPQTRVAELKAPPTADAPMGNSEIIAIGSGVPQPFAVNVVSNGNSKLTFHTGVDPFTGNYQFLFDNNDLIGDGIINYTFEDILVDDTPDFVYPGAGNFLYAGVGAAIDPMTKLPKAIPQYIPGLYMWSEVEDLDTGAKYYSNKLPKILGSLAVLPVAVLRGNVYSSGSAAITTAAQAIRSLGDVSTNVLRDTMFRNVSKIIAGVPKVAANQLELVSDNDKVGFKAGAINGNLAKLLPDAGGIAKVYYHYGDLVLDGGVSDVTWKGERTIIVIGGNVAIKSNIYTQAINGNKPKLGIIVLKDLTASQDAQKKQGHVYIDPAVTNIQANIFADGSIFSAPVPALPQFVAMNGSGEPTFATNVAEQQAALQKHQLFIQGSLASQNTLGGSGLKTPILGSGEEVKGADALMRARMYDLNYLRYYTGVLKRDLMTGAPLCPDGPVLNDADLKLVHPETGAPWTVYDTPIKGCLYSPVDEDSGASGYFYAKSLDPKKDLGATYIYYDPPSATLPGFVAVVGGTQKQLTQ